MAKELENMTEALRKSEQGTTHFLSQYTNSPYRFSSSWENLLINKRQFRKTFPKSISWSLSNHLTHASVCCFSYQNLQTWSVRGQQYKGELLFEFISVVTVL